MQNDDDIKTSFLVEMRFKNTGDLAFPAINNWNIHNSYTKIKDARREKKRLEQHPSCVHLDLRLVRRIEQVIG